MIRRIRIKLISVAMLSLFIVLTVIVAAVNILNYRSIVEDTDNVLTILSENSGHFPKDDSTKENDSSDTEKSDSQAPDEFENNKNPELAYETRYFSVLLNTEGTVIETDTGKIAAVDTTTANSLATDIFNSEKVKGFCDNYRYLRYTEGGNIRIIFVDAGRNLSNFRKVLITSCLVSLFGFLTVLVLLVIFSQRMIRPFSDNYEKQKRFITDAGHDIKTPLTIIAADVEVLEMENGFSEWTSDIRVQIERMTDLTNSLIYLAKMDEDRKQLVMVEFPLSDLVIETAVSFQILAKTQHKDFQFDVAPKIAMNGNADSIHRLLSILLDNAVKYTPEDGNIRLKLEMDGKNIRIIAGWPSFYNYSRI